MGQLSAMETASCAYYTMNLCKSMCCIIPCIEFIHTTCSRQDTAMKYAAQYSYTPEYKNFWNLKIIFTKYLKAHFKVNQCKFNVHDYSIPHIMHAQYIQSDHQDLFEFESNDELHLDLNSIKDIIKINGWEISPSTENNPAKVSFML